MCDDLSETSPLAVNSPSSQTSPVTCIQLGWRVLGVRSRAGVLAAGRHDGGVIRELARVVPAPPGKPVREEAARDWPAAARRRSSSATGRCSPPRRPAS